MKNIIHILAFCLLFFSCKTEQKKTVPSKKLIGKTEQVEETPHCELLETQRVAQSLRDYFGNEVEGLVKENRQFLFDTYDLNNDGKTEYFVGLLSPYFCGSGGCTVLVLNHDLTVQSKLTVVDYPVYVSQRYFTGGWADLFIYSNKSFHIVKSNDGKYPSNPSVEPETDVSNYPARVPLLLDSAVRKCEF